MVQEPTLLRDRTWQPTQGASASKRHETEPKPLHDTLNPLHAILLLAGAAMDQLACALRMHSK